MRQYKVDVRRCCCEATPPRCGVGTDVIALEKCEDSTDHVGFGDGTLQEADVKLVMLRLLSEL